MKKISIVESARTIFIEDLNLSRRTTNCLIARGKVRLGDLDGLSMSDIASMRGVGTSSIQEIAATLESFCVADQVSSQNSATFAAEELAGESEAYRVPVGMEEWPVGVLNLPRPFLAAVAKKHASTLGELVKMRSVDLQSVADRGVTCDSAIRTALEHLEALSKAGVFARYEEQKLRPPKGPLELFDAVAKADSTAQEVTALLYGLSARDAALVSGRWQGLPGAATTLEALAASHGITRERVRQITDRRDKLIRDSNIRLPRLSRLVALIERSGGGISERELNRVALGDGLDADWSVVRYLESLSRLEVIPSVSYSALVKMWLTPIGRVQWLEKGRATELLWEARRVATRLLRHVGCVDIARLPKGDFTTEHVIEVALANQKFRRVGNYLVPLVSEESVITRWMSKMLVVTAELTLDDLTVGLKRGKFVYRRKRQRLEIPPPTVLADVIARNPKFVMEADRVRLRDSVSRETLLSATDLVVVNAIESAGNVATWAEITNAGKAAGCAQPTTYLVLQEPFIVRKGPGLYSLRGRNISPELLRAKTRERAKARRQSVKQVLYTGGTTARVVYSLTTFSLSGVLPIPNKLQGLAHKSWTARLPGGRETRVKFRGGFMWSLSRWFHDMDFKLGDLIVANFDIPNAIVEFDSPS